MTHICRQLTENLEATTIVEAKEAGLEVLMEEVENNNRVVMGTVIALVEPSKLA